MRSATVISLLAVILGIGLATPAMAQEAPAPKRATGVVKPTVVDLEAVTGEKVLLILRSGVPIEGVVKAHRIEIFHGSRYVPSTNRKIRGAGIRVYYALGLNGFIFVPYSTVDEIKFKGKLTADEGLALAKLLKLEDERAERERAQAAADREAKKAAAAAAAAEKERAEEESPVDEPGAVKTPGTREKKADPLASIQDSTRMFNIRELLKRFPPVDWKPSRLDEIKRRAIILNIYPSGEEAAFMEKYDLWLEGYELWKKAEDALGESSASGSDKTKEKSVEDEGNS